LFTKKEQSLGNNFRLHIHILGCGEAGDKEEGLARQRDWVTENYTVGWRTNRDRTFCGA